VLDFGVAKSIDADLQATTMHTRAGQLVGTVGYMSPEQTSGDPDEVDLRSDVYSLGVILYELLTGELPYPVKDKTLHEAVRWIREHDPVRPAKLDPGLRGDPEILLGKALAKERGRRYQTASELADDLAALPRRPADRREAAHHALPAHQVRPADIARWSPGSPPPWPR
jgi:non-specific serine/threonine protein kinase/serine/threonine-protein kinase